jgi:hypothetical protein
MERKTRRPVTIEHPCIAAAVAVLAEVGRPLKVGEIFERAYEKGLLPKSSENTIRGRLSQHLQHVELPAIAHLSERRRWTLTAVGADASSQSTTRRLAGTRLRDVVLTPDWLREHNAPAQFIRYVSARPDQRLTFRAALLSPWADDAALLGWLLKGCGGAFVFEDEGFRDRLRRARGVTGRARVIHAVERRAAVA